MSKSKRGHTKPAEERERFTASQRAALADAGLELQSRMLVSYLTSPDGAARTTQLFAMGARFDSVLLDVDVVKLSGESDVPVDDHSARLRFLSAIQQAHPDAVVCLYVSSDVLISLCFFGDGIEYATVRGVTAEGLALDSISLSDFLHALG